MTEITKCNDAGKYCKSYESCYRFTSKEDELQSYSNFHNNEEVEKCEFYLNKEEFIKDLEEK